MTHLRAANRASTAPRVCPIMAFRSWASGGGTSLCGGTPLNSDAPGCMPCIGAGSGTRIPERTSDGPACKDNPMLHLKVLWCSPYSLSIWQRHV